MGGRLDILTCMKRIYLLCGLLAALVYGSGRAVESHNSLTGFETEGGKPELVLQTGHSAFVQAVVVGPDNKWVASGSFDNTIKIWDITSGQELRSLTGTGPIKTLASSPDGKTLVS